MKKLITLTFALFVTVGIAYGQVNNEAFIQQINADNQGDIEQVGHNNQALIGQGRAENIDFDDGTTINRDPGTATDNGAFLRQAGNDNDGRIFQGTGDRTARDNHAELRQPGNGNDAFIGQGNDGNTLHNSSAEIIQRSDNNVAEIIQAGSNHSASITQN